MNYVNIKNRGMNPPLKLHKELSVLLGFLQDDSRLEGGANARFEVTYIGKQRII
jgi:hypothetical protein